MKTLDLILSLSKDEATLSGFFSILLEQGSQKWPSRFWDKTLRKQKIQAGIRWLAKECLLSVHAFVSLYNWPQETIHTVLPHWDW